MRPNLINRLKEEWNNLDPVDPLRGLLSDAIDALAKSRSDVEQPALELYGWKVGGFLDLFHNEHEAKAAAKEVNGVAFPLYTTPQAQPAQRTWVRLTDEEIDDCWNNLFGTGNYNRRNVYQAIEAKLKEKNA